MTRPASKERPSLLVADKPDLSHAIAWPDMTVRLSWQVPEGGVNGRRGHNVRGECSGGAGGVVLSV